MSIDPSSSAAEVPPQGGPLSSDARLDVRVRRGLEALALVPLPPLRALSPSGDSFAAPLSAAVIAGALGRLPAPETDGIVRAQIRFLLDTLRLPGVWAFGSGVDGGLDRLTTLSALEAVAARGRSSPDLQALVERALDQAEAGPFEMPSAAVALRLARPEGRARPRLAERMARAIRTDGLDAPPGTSALVAAWQVARWLETASPGGARDPLAEQVVSLVREELRRRPVATALEAAAALVSLFALDAVDVSVHALARVVWEGQDAGGLWAPAAFVADAAGTSYGSAPLSTALCLDALFRYARGGSALYRPPRPRAPAVAAGPAPALCGPRPASLDSMLEAVAECVPPALVSEESFARLKAITSGFPFVLANGFGLECRLGDDAAAADLALLVQPGQGREILAGRQGQAQAPEALFEHPVWSRVRTLCAAWAEPGGLAERHVEGLWLEFDVDGPPPSPPVPSVFLALRDDARAWPREELERRQARLAGDALGILWGREVPAGLAETLARCLAAVPPGANVFAVAAMVARGSEAVRLGVKNIAPSAIVPYLDRIGWTGSRALVARWVANLASLGDRLFLNVDVADTVLPTFGLECSLRRPPIEEPRWEALLRFLESEGLCRPDKRRGLLAWPGPFYAEATVEGERWISCFDNLLSHVKVGVGSRGKLEAKAYIGAWQSYSGKAVGPRAGAPPAADPVTATAATARARAFLDDALACGRCHDVWGASRGAPPVERSHAVFLAYFAVRALAETGGVGPLAERAARACLAATRRGEAYAYDAVAPADADDTAFALRTRILLGDRVGPEDVGLALSRFAWGATWRTFARPAPATAGWVAAHEDEASSVGPHPEVHLNVLALLREAGAPVTLPTDLPSRDGLYHAYHYPSRVYAAWLAAEAGAGAAERAALDRALIRLQCEDGGWPEVEGGFSREQETALALLACTAGALAAASGRRGARFLQDRQRADGSFEGGVLWRYHPSTGAGAAWWAEDVMRVMSTALAALALARDPS